MSIQGTREMVDIKIWRGSDNILHVILPPGSLLPEHVERWCQVLSRLNGSGPYATLVHAQQLRSLDWRAADMLASAQMAPVVHAVAFVTGVSRDAAEALQLFTYFHKPSYDLRVFTSRFLAIRWLQSLGTAAAESPRFPELFRIQEPIAAH